MRSQLGASTRQNLRDSINKVVESRRITRAQARAAAEKALIDNPTRGNSSNNRSTDGLGPKTRAQQAAERHRLRLEMQRKKNASKLRAADRW